MKISSAWARHVVNGLALLTGAATFTYEVTDERKKAWAAKAYETSFHPTTPWDYNWDKREPESLINPADENQSKECLAKVKSHSNRHIFLIRHGQYNLDGATDEERYLTPLGREQAEVTGQRLQELGFPYNFIVRSTMTRAVETGKIISKHLASVPVKNCDMIREGAPIPPEPPVGHWKPEAKQFFEDGARIEAAFRHYFHRALPEQETDSYEIYVCHANVIRYLVCRAMQFPPEAWLRFSLHHCSITWLTIRPSGRVILRTLGDTGHISPDKMTTS